MATAPVLDPIESRSIDQDAATAGFQRLAGVRARQRVRRRHRAILVTAIVMALAGGGVLGFTTVRDRRPPRPPAPVAAPPPAPMTTTLPAPMITPPPAPTIRTPPAPMTTTPPPIETPPLPAPRAAAAKREAPARPPSRAESPRDGDPTSARGEPEETDPTAAIDWLLKTPRPAGR